MKFLVQAGTVDGLEISPAIAYEHMQILNIGLPGYPKDLGTIRVYEPGVFEPTASAQGETVSIAGRRGIYYPLLESTNPSIPSKPTLAWQYDGAGWATMQGDFRPDEVRDELVRIASGLQFVSPYPAIMPCYFTYLPSGLRLVSVFQFPGSDWVRSIVSYDSRPNLDVAGSGLYEFAVSVTARVREDKGHQPSAAVTWQGDSAFISFGDLELSIGSGQGAPHVGRPEIEKMVNGMQCANWVDSRTWYKAP